MILFDDIRGPLLLLTDMVGLEPEATVVSIHIMKNKLIVWYIDASGIRRMKHDYIV